MPSEKFFESRENIQKNKNVKNRKQDLIFVLGTAV